MDKINPFRNSEKDELVNAVRAVLSGQKYVAPEKEVEEHKGDKPHKHPHEETDPVDSKAAKKKFNDRQDKDIDNDGDVDDSDEYLHKRRKAIASKEGMQKPYVSSDRDGKHVMNGSGKVDKTFPDMNSANAYLKKHYRRLVKEAVDEAILKDRDYEVDEKEGVVKISKKNFAKVRKDAKGTDKSKPTMMVLTKKGTSLYPVQFTEEEDNPANYQHICAKNVVHEKWGGGDCIPTMHADPDESGNVAWYDVMFEHGIEAKVSIDELKVTKAETHIHSSKKKNGKKDEVDTKPTTGEDRGTAE